jgi:predicted ribosome quality control (RQC) complex YloA/Tae2 family protein
LFSHSAQILFDEQERQALKKLENIRNDHSQRLTQLQKDQLEDRRKGELIEMNSNLVDKALMMIRSAIANQVFFILC